MQPNAPYTPAPAPSPQPQAPTPEQTPGYDFIMNPSKPPRRRLLPQGTSPIIRVGIVLASLLVLVILFSVIRSFFSHSNTPALTTVVQDQQEMIHITTNANQLTNGQQTLSTSYHNFSLTAQLSLTSAQSDLLTYMQNNGKKVKAKTLAATISKNLDDQFTAAATNNTYNQLFKQTMQNKLNQYEQALKIAYGQTKGPKGRALLSKEYDAAQLLLTQLNEPSN
jgi:hypothetical protein